MNNEGRSTFGEYGSETGHRIKVIEDTVDYTLRKQHRNNQYFRVSRNTEGAWMHGHAQ